MLRNARGEQAGMGQLQLHAMVAWYGIRINHVGPRSIQSGTRLLSSASTGTAQ